MLYLQSTEKRKIQEQSGGHWQLSGNSVRLHIGNSLVTVCDWLSYAMQFLYKSLCVVYYE